MSLATAATSETIVSVRNLRVTFNTPTGPVRAVRGVDLDIARGQTLGIVGESGCGKSVSLRSLLGLTPASADVSGQVTVDRSEASELTSGSPVETASVLRDMSAMVYQSPGAALNPVFTIGQQLALAAASDDRSVLAALLDDVGLPDPDTALDRYPHEYSGGMRQRAVIAIALAQSPELLVADEPTTALDVTTQRQILDLIDRLRAERGLSVAFVSHDLAVIDRVADRVAVMYAGRVVEDGPTERVLNEPRHPYTRALLQSIPGPTAGSTLATIPGSVPSGRDDITGCAFAERCPHVHAACAAATPTTVAVQPGHVVACVLAEEDHRG